MPAETDISELVRTAVQSAVHLEMRESYMPADPDWLDWQAGNRFDPAKRWREWFDLVAAAVARGVAVRRARIVSEPITDYVRFEYDVTPGINLAAGEQVRWLPRRNALDLLVPVSDFWLIDGCILAWNHFAGDGSWLATESSDDPGLAKLCGSSFEAIWDRATPHADYQPT